MDVSLILKSILVAGAVIVGVSSTWLFKLKNDNAIEQAAEEVIKNQTGSDVDLSPE